MRRLWPLLCLLIASSAPAGRAPVTLQSFWEHNRTWQQHLHRDSSSYISIMEQYMRPELDPCEDFHAYACGNWRSVHGDKASAMVLSESRINERYVLLFKNLLPYASARERAEPVFAKLLSYFDSCKRNRLQLEGYMQYLELPNAPHNWFELLAHLARYGYSEHFVRVAISQHNISTHNIVIQPHNTRLRVNLTTEVYAALRSYTRTQHSIAALRTEFARLEQVLSEIVESNTSQTDEETSRYYSFQQLKQDCDELDWQRVLTLQLGRPLEPEHWLLVDELPAIKELANYLNKADATLLTLYTLARFLNYLQERPHNPLNSAEGFTNHNCVRHMRKTLYLSMNYAYEQNYYFKQRAQDEHIIFEIFKELKQQFSRTLQTNALGFSAQLVQAMQEKLAGLRLNVGNMPQNVSREFYNDGIKQLQVGNSFHKNHLQSLLHYHKHLAELERSGNSVWYSFNYHGPELSDNIDATPYFYCLSSIIILPYAYLQPPFYSAQFPAALLYGDLANTLGHEMLHVFDTYFVDYDAHGNMKDYTSELLNNELYVSHVNCLNDSVHTMLNERTSDISGTRLALDTYKTRMDFANGDGRLFFLQFAQFFCGDHSDLFHDAGSKRLNYTMAAMPEFSEVFKCAPGTPMNPTQRCRYL